MLIYTTFPLKALQLKLYVNSQFCKFCKSTSGKCKMEINVYKLICKLYFLDIHSIFRCLAKICLNANLFRNAFLCWLKPEKYFKWAFYFVACISWVSMQKNNKKKLRKTWKRYCWRYSLCIGKIIGREVKIN